MLICSSIVGYLLLGVGYITCDLFKLIKHLSSSVSSDLSLTFVFCPYRGLYVFWFAYILDFCGSYFSNITSYCDLIYSYISSSQDSSQSWRFHRMFLYSYWKDSISLEDDDDKKSCAHKVVLNSSSTFLRNNCFYSGSQNVFIQFCVNIPPRIWSGLTSYFKFVCFIFVSFFLNFLGRLICFKLYLCDNSLCFSSFNYSSFIAFLVSSCQTFLPRAFWPSLY